MYDFWNDIYFGDPYGTIYSCNRCQLEVQGTKTNDKEILIPPCKHDCMRKHCWPISSGRRRIAKSDSDYLSKENKKAYVASERGKMCTRPFRQAYSYLSDNSPGLLAFHEAFSASKTAY